MLKRWLALGGVAVTTVLVAGLATLLVAGFVFAQGPTPPANPWGQGGWGPGGMMGPGWGGMMGGMGWMHNQMWDTVARALDMSRDQLWAEFRAGKTLRQIGQEKGLTPEQLSQTLLDAMRQNMQQAVEQGWMTQAQVDAMLQYMQQVGIENMLDHMGGGMPGVAGGCHGGTLGGSTGSTLRQPGGMMGGFRGGMLGGWSRY